jgi:hypothetical protein
VKNETADALIAILATVIGLVGICVVLYLGAAIASRMTYPMDRAQFEQIRRDAADVDPSQAEDVIGQVVDANRRLANVKACNSTWYCDVTKPDAWNSVEQIPVPKLAK